MDKTLLPSLGIVAGIMTLAYYVGGSKEVRWAETEFGEEIDYSIEDKDGMISWTDKDRTQKYFKDWKPKDYPYEKRVVSETKSKWCENCGELDDADENSWNYYQFILKQKNSSTPAMRYITGGHCEGCGSDLCQNCIEGRTSGNFNPLFEPACDDCGYIFCKECKDEDGERCHSCQERYEEDVCDCCGHVHHAESFSEPVNQYDWFRLYMESDALGDEASQWYYGTDFETASRDFDEYTHGWDTVQLVGYTIDEDGNEDQDEIRFFSSGNESFSAEGLFCPSCKDNTRMDEDEEWCHLCEASYEAESFGAEGKMGEYAWVVIKEWRWPNPLKNHQYETKRDWEAVYLSTDEAKKGFNLSKGTYSGDWKDGWFEQEQTGYNRTPIGSYPMTIKWKTVPIRRFGYDALTHQKKRPYRPWLRGRAESFGVEENEMCPSCDKAKIDQDHNRYLVCPLCDWRSDEQVPCRHLNIEITDTDYAGEYEGGVIVYASCEDCGADLQAFGVWEE